MENLTEFGKKVKHKLIDMGKTQAWLIQQVRERTGVYCDSSNLYKIMTGQIKSSKVTATVEEILGVTYSDDGEG